MLHVLKTEGEPMVHLTNHRKAEVVLFNAEQEFQTPLALKAGEHILITAPSGSKTITISRYELGQSDRRQETSRRIADVIRTVSELDASYPDVAQMLIQAEHQQNLPGMLKIDALPQAGRIYYRPDPTDPESQGRKTHVGNDGLVPNLFEGARDERHMEPAADGSWDPPAQKSEPDDIEEDVKKDAEKDDEKDEKKDKEAVAPQDDVLKDPRKWYDLRRILKPNDYSMTDEEFEGRDESELD